MTQIKNFFNGWLIFAITIMSIIGIVNFHDFIYTFPGTGYAFIGTLIFIFIVRFIQIIKIKQRINK